MARIFPVIEAPRRAEPFWMKFPQPPWPAFIELSERAPIGEVALVLLQLSTYGFGCDVALSVEELAEHFRR